VEALLEIKARLNGPEGCLANWTVTAAEGQALSPSLVRNWTGITRQLAPPTWPPSRSILAPAPG